MNPPAAARPFLRRDGSFRFISAQEFSALSSEDKIEYLDAVSKVLRKGLEELRETIERQDREFNSLLVPSRNDN